jgi:hypothetical protein
MTRVGCEKLDFHVTAELEGIVQYAGLGLGPTPKSKPKPVYAGASLFCKPKMSLFLHHPCCPFFQENESEPRHKTKTKGEKRKRGKKTHSSDFEKILEFYLPRNGLEPFAGCPNNLHIHSTLIF